MMSIDHSPVADLYDGIGIIYDDDLVDNKSNTPVHKIVDQIESRKIPLLKEFNIPDTPDEVVKHFRNISFIILDWDFSPPVPEKDKGVSVGDTLKKYFQDKIIAFLTSIFKNTFCPVFIFSKESQDAIDNVLKKTFSQSPTNLKRVFICNKSELIDETLFKKIESWLQSNPSVYTVKKWEREHSLARISLFNKFEMLNPKWPKVLWDNFTKDGVPPSEEISNILLRNLHAALSPFEFSEAVFNNIDADNISPEDIRMVLSAERFLPNDLLHPQDVAPGDLFILEKKLLINIRPACDCVNRNGEELILYLLKGNKLSSSKEKESYNSEYGHFMERECQAIVFALHKGKSYVFHFKELQTIPWKMLKDKRIGRLLPPYITRIQQRYAAYLQREGLPRVPLNAIHSLEN